MALYNAYSTRYNVFMLKKTVYFRNQEDLDLFNLILNKAEWLHKKLHADIQEAPEVRNDPAPGDQSGNPRVIPMGKEDWPA